MLQNQVGALRLSKEEQAEAERMGFESASKYLRHKLSEKEDGKIDRLEEEVREDTSNEKEAPIMYQENINATGHGATELMSETQKRIRAEEELKYVKQKMQEQTGQLNGYLGEVDKRIQEELLKRDYHDLKEKYADAEKELAGLEKENEKLEKETRELEKQLGVLETIKEFTPQIVNGLAGWFPKQAEKIANNLAGVVTTKSLPEDDDNLQFAIYFKSLFTENELQDVMDLCIAISQDKNLLPMLKAYLSKIKNKEFSA